MRWFLIALLVAGTAAAQTTEMYRTIAADGTITFSDVPLNDNSELITVLVRSGTTAAVRDAPTAPGADTARAEPQTAEEQRAAERAANCARAREHEQGIQSSNRLYRVLANGGREFLTDEEVAAAREAAATEVARWCAGA